MAIAIRALASDDVDAVVEFSMRAWAPNFASLREVLGGAIYQQIYPDWLAQQARAVETVCRDEAMSSWVAVVDGGPVGFAAVKFHSSSDPEPNSGQLDMIAVDPLYQRQGIADALIAHAVDHIRAAGAKLAVIGTGGDLGHAPARAAYEKAGFTPLPIFRYYQAL